jgi:hypothetical protein
MKKRSTKAAKATAEPWEVERLHKEFPVKSEQELEEVLERCKETERPQTTEEATRCVQRKISK